MGKHHKAASKSLFFPILMWSNIILHQGDSYGLFKRGPHTFTALFGWFSVRSEGSGSSCEQKFLAAFINTNNANMFFGPSTAPSICSHA